MERETLEDQLERVRRELAELKARKVCSVVAASSPGPCSTHTRNDSAAARCPYLQDQAWRSSRPASTGINLAVSLAWALQAC